MNDGQVETQPLGKRGGSENMKGRREGGGGGREGGKEGGRERGREGERDGRRMPQTAHMLTNLQCVNID